MARIVTGWRGVSSDAVPTSRPTAPGVAYSDMSNRTSRSPFVSPKKYSASFFRPYLSRGDVLAVAECTPEQLPVIERNAPQLLGAFQQIRVEEPAAAAG